MLHFVLILYLSGLSSLTLASEVNINLRNTDVNELKSQIIPSVDQVIHILEELQGCLPRSKKPVDCLHVIRSELKKPEALLKGRNLLAKAEKKISKYDRFDDKASLELSLAIILARQAKLCLQESKNANDIQDCFHQFK
jgi:hypothetical protein